MAEPSRRGQLHLPDGRTVEFEIRRSEKARSLRLTVSARRGLVVHAPKGLEHDRLVQLVCAKAPWIAGRLAEFDKVRHLVSTAVTARPQAFDLPALADSWRIEYKATRSKTVGATTDRPGRIVVAGAVDDVETCCAALRRWLARHAKPALSPWLQGLAEQSGLDYLDLAIKNQRTRWGSCTPQGRISLNCKLLFLPRDLVRYVMIHELCHTIEPSHSGRFWACVGRIEPNADRLHAQMRDAWKLIPTWAQRSSGLSL